jgi:2-C-methyl-D-erythritol 2,4-cyclodiphosphate synthase
MVLAYFGSLKVAILNSDFRTGVGIDAHQYGETGPCNLAGLQWPEARVLVGHSDGDAAVHAICDALLSACQLGDIGEFFGIDRPQWAGASGVSMLKKIRQHLSENNFKINNVSIQIMGNEPKISPRRSEAQEVLSAALGAPVSIAATTSDGLGFTGRGEGVLVIANALVIAI